MAVMVGERDRVVGVILFCSFLGDPNEMQNRPDTNKPNGLYDVNHAYAGLSM